MIAGNRELTPIKHLNILHQKEHKSRYDTFFLRYCKNITPKHNIYITPTQTHTQSDAYQIVENFCLSAEKKQLHKMTVHHQVRQVTASSA